MTAINNQILAFKISGTEGRYRGFLFLALKSSVGTSLVPKIPGGMDWPGGLMSREEVGVL